MYVLNAQEYARPNPLAPSDTVDNLKNGNGRALAIQNRSANLMYVNVAFDGEVQRTLILPSAAIQRWGSWLRVMSTGTTGGGHSVTSYEVIKTTGNGLGFANQPANDGIEVLSSSAADTTQTVTFYGTTNGSDTVVVETVTLTGTTFVPTVKTNWGVLLGYELSAACAGTVTVREASGDATISTCAPGTLSKGVETVAATAGGWATTPPIVAASDTSTKQIGVVGTDLSGAVAYDSQALTGATKVEMNSSFGTITKILTGDVETNRTVSVYNGSDLLVYW